MCAGASAQLPGNEIQYPREHQAHDDKLKERLYAEDDTAAGITIVKDGESDRNEEGESEEI
jgi:hypothetical protein